MHVWSGYPLYLTEAWSRMEYYPPPYYDGFDWYYVAPWLWFDGDKHGSSHYSSWETKIVQRMNQPAPVAITMWGNYSPSQGTGTIYTKFRNDSTQAITGRVFFVITEDSIYYEAPNGDNWHNHVARDYIPGPQNGQVIYLTAGDSVTVNKSFTIQPSWNEERCDIVTWIQNNVMQIDSTKEVWQGGIIKITELTGIEEEPIQEIPLFAVTSVPNPCVSEAKFFFSLPNGVEYSITFFDISGSHIKRLHGVSSGNRESVYWDLKDDGGFLVSAGVYLYRFESQVINSTGKLVVR